MSDSEQLHRAVDAARAAYDGADEHLRTVAGNFYADAHNAADQLLEIAEQYGSGKAITAMLGNVEQFGEVKATDSYVADMSDTLEEALEAVLVARDRLDQATAERERALRQTNPARLQVININGREFVIDASRRVLRSVDNPDERYVIAEDAEPTRATHDVPVPSLTEQLAEQHQVPAAQPSKDRTPTRSR